MQRLEVSGAVRPIYVSLGVKGLILVLNLATVCLLDVYHVPVFSAAGH